MTAQTHAALRQQGAAHGRYAAGVPAEAEVWMSPIVPRELLPDPLWPALRAAEVEAYRDLSADPSMQEPTDSDDLGARLENVVFRMDAALALATDPAASDAERSIGDLHLRRVMTDNPYAAELSTWAASLDHLVAETDAGGQGAAAALAEVLTGTHAQVFLPGDVRTAARDRAMWALDRRNRAVERAEREAAHAAIMDGSGLDRDAASVVRDFLPSQADLHEVNTSRGRPGWFADGAVCPDDVDLAACVIL